MTIVMIVSICFFSEPGEAFGSFSYRAGRGVMWTWVGGPQTATLGTYGTKGVPSTSNIPAKRGLGCAAADKLNGLVYLFGGNTLTNKNNYMNDLWRYNMSTGEWTWLHGGSTGGDGGTGGVWGTKGTPAAANTPSARQDHSCWTDSSGNFWVFGGLLSTSENYNDLWRFTPSNGMWTWMSGSNTTNPTAVYGTKGVEAAANVPAGRERMARWSDSSGNLWLFGGYDNTASVRRNDLWRYNISTGMWTWISGTNGVDQNGVYGTKGTPSTSNYPSARRNNPGTVDSYGNFWLFGGDNTSGRLNDLWRYNPSTNEWTWMAGSQTANPTGVFGTKLIPHTNNVAKARSLAAMAYKAGQIFVFFGYDGSAELSDFMGFSPDSMLWTWLGGSNATNTAGVYGTLNVPQWANLPGGRDGMMTWQDSSGAIWFFGGITSSAFNDFWKATPY